VGSGELCRGAAESDTGNRWGGGVGPGGNAGGGLSAPAVCVLHPAGGERGKVERSGNQGSVRIDALQPATSGLVGRGADEIVELAFDLGQTTTRAG
jgi:hypothetical protein